jgi:hypothetical protein
VIGPRHLDHGATWIWLIQMMTLDWMTARVDQNIVTLARQRIQG